MSPHLLIIGGGPAGEAAAKFAAKAGATVTLVEKENAGGLCLNKGCIPSKTLLERIHDLHLTDKEPNWADIQAAKTNVVQGIRTQLETAFKTLKIKHVQGAAKFTGKKTVEVSSSTGTETISFDKAIICTGTEIFYPAPLDQFKNELLNSDRLLETTKTPKTAVIVGGGAVGCEFACLLHAAGSKVTLLEMKDTLLPGEDPAVVRALTQSFEARGIAIKTGVTVKNLSKKKDGWEVELSNGEKLSTEWMAACVGRLPDVRPLQIEKAGIELDGRTVKLNAQLQTSNPDIYAAGDVTLQTRLAHAAAVQGEVAAKNALGEKATYDGSLVPRCLYTWPEVASVGKWAYELESEKKPVKTSRGFFKGSAKALAADQAEGFVQIVFDPGSGKILGAQIIGPHATELIHIFSVAMKASMTTNDLGSVMFAHPTLSEVIKDAARK